MFQDITKYEKDCPQCQTAKGDYTEPNTIPGVIIANKPMDLPCIDFTKADPSKENILFEVVDFLWNRTVDSLKTSFHLLL